MTFAYPLPWWLGVVVAAAVAALAFFEYRRPLAPLTRVQRAVLIGCRASALAALVIFLCRPIVLLPPAGAHGAMVPVLIDVSRSMRLNDADGQTRIARAAAIVRNELLPALSGDFTAELYTAGEGLAPADVKLIDRLSADARQTDLTGALAAVRERYRGQRVAGIVVVSDGGDTGQQPPVGADAGGAPVFAVGLGSRASARFMKLCSNPGAPSTTRRRRFRPAGLTSTLRALFSTTGSPSSGGMSAV